MVIAIDDANYTQIIQGMWIENRQKNTMNPSHKLRSDYAQKFLRGHDTILNFLTATIGHRFELGRFHNFLRWFVIIDHLPDCRRHFKNLEYSRTAAVARVETLPTPLTPV